MASYEDFKYVENNVTKTLSDLININSDLKSDYCRSFHNYYKLDGDSTKYYCAYAYFSGPTIKSYPLVLNGELTMHRPVVRFPWGRLGLFENLFYNMPTKDNTEGLNASYKEGSPIPKRVHANPALATSSIGCLHINNLSSTTTLQYDSTSQRVIITHPSGVQEVKLKNHVFIIDIQAPGGSGAAADAGKTLTYDDNYSGGGGGGGAFISFVAAFGTSDSALTKLEIKSNNAGDCVVNLYSGTSVLSSAFVAAKGLDAVGKTGGYGGSAIVPHGDPLNDRTEDIERYGVFLLTANDGGNGGAGGYFETYYPEGDQGSPVGNQGNYAGGGNSSSVRNWGNINTFPLASEVASMGEPGQGGLGLRYTSVGSWLLYGGGGGGGSSVGRGGQGGGVSQNTSTLEIISRNLPVKGAYGGGGGGGACVGDSPQSGAAGGNGYINIYW